MITFSALFKRRVKHSRAYVEFHNSARWQVVRAHVILRANGYCERCHKEPIREVHILKYPSMLWHTTPEMCLGACQECHRILDKEREAETGRRLTR